MTDPTIYLDYAATTPLGPQVREAMQPWLDAGYGNPASDHALGRAARAAVERARGQVAGAIGAQADEIVWTSGATEADNLAIKGAVEFHTPPGLAPHVVTSRVEHRAVLDTCRYLEGRGVRVTYLDPQPWGGVEVDQVVAALAAETVLVSLIWVNNETGAINDVPALATALRERGVLFHVDAAQAAGHVPIDVAAVPVDLLTLSGHKAYGPKGIGALFVRRRPRARLAPQMHGGGHEWGMRSGTLATHQIVGMGEAFAGLHAVLAGQARLRQLRERLWHGLGALPGILRNSPEGGSAHVLNVGFPGVEGEALRAALPELAVSSGSACSSATREPSYVLRAIGREDRLADASLRFSLGTPVTGEFIDRAAATVVDQVRRLRALNPDTESGATDRPAPADRDVFGYGAAVWQRFRRPERGGAPAVGAAIGRARSRAADLTLELSFTWRDQRAADARFRAFGCPTTVAVGQWLAENIEGADSKRLAALGAAAVRRALEIPETRAHCALLGEDALCDARSRIEEAVAT